jgi:hypothetical protein
MTAARLPDAFLDALRARAPLAALISRRVRLARAGRDYVGLCPFHGESTPSFTVYADHYHCFGCGAHGDAVRFTMQMQGLSFLDAVRQLAAEVGLIVPGQTRDADMPAVRSHFGEGGPVAQTVQLPEPARRAADVDAKDVERRRRAALRLYLDAQDDLAGTPVAFYLDARGISLQRLGRYPRALRYHPALWHEPSRASYPAMVAAISGADGVHVATHRTWLQRDTGGVWIKARIEKPKMVLGSFAGGCIRLWKGASKKTLRDAAAGEPVVIGEGIETCLSIAMACPELRILSAVSLGNMGAVELPPQVKQVILAAENDARPTACPKCGAPVVILGLKCDSCGHPFMALLHFQRAVERHLDAGRAVRVARSSVGSDFNDALRAWSVAA